MRNCGPVLVTTMLFNNERYIINITSVCTCMLSIVALTKTQNWWLEAEESLQKVLVIFKYVKHTKIL